MELPDVLYHGTTKGSYDRVCNRNEIYRGDPILLKEDIESAVKQASQKAGVYDSSPLLLIIDTVKVSNRIKEATNDTHTIRNLKQGEYIMIDVPSEGITPEFLEQAKAKVKKAFGKELNI